MQRLWGSCTTREKKKEVVFSHGGKKLSFYELQARIDVSSPYCVCAFVCTLVGNGNTFSNRNDDADIIIIVVGKSRRTNLTAPSS